MARPDRYDLLGYAGLLLLSAAILGLLVLAPRGTGAAPGKGLDLALEQELRQRARLELVARLYGEVERQLAEGRPAQAQLALVEVQRQWPGEAHGLMLQGRIQQELGAAAEAAASYAAAVRLDGGYLDRHSPLSRREALAAFVAAELPRAQAEGRSAASRLKTLYYLQSRLAGGCE